MLIADLLGSSCVCCAANAVFVWLYYLHVAQHTRAALPLLLLPVSEYRAIRNVISHDGLRMNSTKSMIGHLLGGAGAVEAVATIKAIETGEKGPWGKGCVLWGQGEGGVELTRGVGQL